MTFIANPITIVDNNNSSTTQLLLNTTFTGVGTITSGYNSLLLNINSNVNSAAGGLIIQFSDNNISFTTVYSDTIFANSLFIKSYPIIKLYYRISYTNDGTNTTNLSIVSRLSTTNAEESSNSISAFDNSVENAVDAFGKLRVTNPYTILDIRFPGQSTGSTDFLSNKQQLSTYSTGAITTTYSNSKLTVSTTGIGTFVSQTRNYSTYQPGKSLLFMMSGILNNGSNASTVTSRIGYFDGTSGTIKNGLYFQYSNNVVSVNVVNLTSSITTITQTDWNIDKMNGTGNSGISLDFSKAQLFVIDMEWLGVGRVRFGFYAYGHIHYCHQIININSLTAAYTASINLPICIMLENTGANSGSMVQMCATVISEGGYNPAGKPFSIQNSTGTSVGGTEVAILAIRGGGSNYYHQNIIPTSVSVISGSSTDIYIYNIRLYLDPTTSDINATWNDVNTKYSVTQYATSFSTFTTTNSIIVDQNLFYGRVTNAEIPLNNVFSSIQQITSNASNVSDVLVISCQKISGGAAGTIYGAINWQEIY